MDLRNLWCLLIIGIPMSFPSMAQSSNEQTDESKGIVADSVYVNVDTPPEFPGGINAMLDYLQKNISYPANAQINNVQGKVLIQFAVDEAGKVIDTKVIESVDEELDNEAVRLVEGMPDWIPATLNGQPVKTYGYLPVTFRLQEAGLFGKKDKKDKKEKKKKKDKNDKE